MANQTASPHEAEIAKKKLEELPEENILTSDLVREFNIEFTDLGATFWRKQPASGWKPPRTDPKNPGEDIYNEYVWQWNYSENKWNRW